MSLHWLISRHLVARPTRVVVTDDRRAYRGIDILVGALHAANAIDAATSRRHVGLMLPTSGAFPIAALATWMTGRVVVPLNYLFKRDELQYVVDDAEIDTIVTVGPMLDFIGEPPERAGLLRLDEIEFRSVPAPRVPAFSEPGDLAALLYTSGTSGKPKGVMLSHGAIRANVRQGVEGMGLRKSDTMLGVLPQFHAYGMTQLTLTPLINGIPVVYTARFVPRKLVELVREHRATVVIGIPSMFNALASAKSGGPDDFASVRLVVSGSEPLSDATFDKFFEKFGKPINEGYGMTEMAPATHCCLCGADRKHSVGPPLPAIRQRIVDVETGRDLPPGRDGEVRLDGPNKMLGYWKLPDVSESAFDEQGFYRTGDLGRLAPDGFLSITGRIKEMIIVGGENVFPREIEDVLNRHPAVHASGCTGQGDPMRGEVPVAFVELEEGAQVTPRELMAFCREHLAGYKVPREVRVVEKLPRSPTGKVLRRELKALIAPATPAPADDATREPAAEPAGDHAGAA